jgi:hypothetical protein
MFPGWDGKCFQFRSGESSMVEMAVRGVVPTTSPDRRSVLLQRILAVPLVAMTLVFGAFLLAAAGAAITGDLQGLTLGAILSVITVVLGKLSVSLFRGDGVPAWVMKLFFAAGVCGYSYLVCYSLWLSLFTDDRAEGLACLVILISQGLALWQLRIRQASSR